MGRRYLYAAKAVVCCVVFLWPTALVCADETSWQGSPPGPQDWHVPANWTDGVPATGLEAYVDNGGTAEIRGAEAQADRLHVGYDVLGTVRQIGGTSSFSMAISLGEKTGSEGTLEMAGGSVATLDLVVGTQGTGRLTQTSGVVHAQLLRAGGAIDGFGTISLGGDGEIHSSFMTYVGHYGGGEFIQTGGVHTALLGVGLGLHEDSSGAYDIRAGSLRTGQLVVGAIGTGTLRIQPPADVALTDRLAIGVDGRLAGDCAGTIKLLGADMTNLSTDPAHLAGLAGVTLVAQGGVGATTHLEMAGEDRGATAAGWTDNFVLGTLRVGGDAPGQVMLVDDTTNQPGWDRGEAMYVETLSIGAGGSIIGAGRLYYRNGQQPKRFFTGDANLDGRVGLSDLLALADSYGLSAGGAWGRGDFTADGRVGLSDLMALADNYGRQTESPPVPEPQAMAMIILGGAALLRARRRRR